MKRKTNPDGLFKTPLHELMTGQRRVNEIDLSFDKLSPHTKQIQRENEDNEKE